MNTTAMNTTGCAAWIAAIVVAMASLPAAAGSLPDGPYVSTSASAVEEVAPDFAVIDLQYRVVEDTPEAARSATDRAQRRLVELLGRFEDAIRDQRLEAMQFGEEYEFDREQQKQVRTGYYGSFEFRLEVNDFETLPELHFALAGLEWNSLGNPRFEVADPEAHENTVRLRALEKAGQRAADLARAQGARLGPVWGIIHEPMHDLAGRSPGVIGDDRGPAPRLSVSMAEGRFALPMEPRPVRFETRVGVVYRLLTNP